MNTQEERLRQEIWNEATKKAQGIVDRARLDANRLLEAAKQAAGERRRRRLADAEASAASVNQSRLQEVEHQIVSNWLQRREGALEELLSAALAEAENSTGSERRRSYAFLAKEMLLAMQAADSAFLVHFPENDASFVTRQWLEEIAAEALPGRRLEFRLLPEKGMPAGLRFETADGHLSYDNTYAARLKRDKAVLRTLVLD